MLNSQMLFPEAANLWLNEKREEVSPGMVHDYQSAIKALRKFFGLTALADINAAHVKVYVRSRHVWGLKLRRTVGASRIRKELCTLGQILSAAGLEDEWRTIRRSSKPPRLPESCGIALEPSEEAHLFELASKNPRWLVAYLCSLITMNTTAGPGEILNLQLRDVELERRQIHVRQCMKTSFRVRTIPLNEEALWAIEQLVARGRRMGACQPDHYLLPHRAATAGAPADPTLPQGVWRKAWRELRAAAAKSYPRLAKLRRYDLRHTAITKAFESGQPEAVVQQLAGHRVGSRITERYSHIRMQAKREAVEVLQTGQAAERAPLHSTGLASSTLAFFRRIG